MLGRIECFIPGQIREMAYKRIQASSPGTDAAAAEALSFLEDLASRKEFRMYEGFRSGLDSLSLSGLRLTGAQAFVQGFESPDTPYSRLLIKWQTGTGKSIAALSIAREFVKAFRRRAASGVGAPTVVVISFTARETIQRDMLKYPEFGFITPAEAASLQRLEAEGVTNPAAMRSAAIAMGVLRRRMTDRRRGGFYQFYGYREFASRLFTPTRAGTAAGFDVQKLYARGEDDFGERLSQAVRKGQVLVNQDLLDSLKGGLLIADEIHNVYNIQEKNNYGIAIQYALDALAADAPRVVFMSATPMTGSAAEVVDLLNLLVPRAELPGGVHLKRSDFFSRASSAEDDEVVGASSQLREGATRKISHLVAGRVSFLLDSDVGSYPRREFSGVSRPEVPYLKLTPCPMSSFHEQVLADAIRDGSAASYALNDMVFPNPEGGGLYAADTAARLASAPASWREKEGVQVGKGAAVGAPAGTYIISGGFLEKESLKKYSTKYSVLLDNVLAAIKDGPGKIMVYHHRVRMTGVLLLQEMFRMNGFVDETASPTDQTICAICGSARGVHTSQEHTWTPARFAVAHSDVDRTAMMRSLARFNAQSNREGYQIRLLIGSAVVKEGLNFRAVRHQLVVSLPTDYPTLLQVFGRVARKDSHAGLPDADRNVTIKILVSTHADGTPSPELKRYAAKGQEFLVIQEVERALHEWAIDGFVNYPRIKAALPEGAGIDALPYAPVVKPQSGKPKTVTFDAYGFGDKEVAHLEAICRRLFKENPVWTYEDLWRAVQSGRVVTPVSPAMFSEDNFAAAVVGLSRPAGMPPMQVVPTGRFFVLAPATPLGPDLDVESYQRSPPADAREGVRLTEYIKGARASHNWALRVKELDELYGDPPLIPLELILLDYNAEFHWALQKRLIEEPNTAITKDDNRLRKLYRRFKTVVTTGEAAAARARRGPAQPPGTLVGYIGFDAVHLWGGGQWYSAPLTDFGVGRRTTENNLVVGYTEANGTGGGARFKLRAPAHKLRSTVTTVRSLARGAVCTTRSRAELETYIKGINAYMKRHSKDRGRAPLGQTATDTCRQLAQDLLMLEEESRAASMADGLRWAYIYCDRPPTIMALFGKEALGARNAAEEVDEDTAQSIVLEGDFAPDEDGPPGDEDGPPSDEDSPA